MLILTTHSVEDIRNIDVDIVEIRVDLLKLNLKKVYEHYRKYSKKILLTYRSKQENLDYETRIRMLASLRPDYIDIQVGCSINLISTVRNISPRSKIILSYHNYAETPDNLSEILWAMKTYNPDYFKLVTFANSSVDSLKMLQFLKNNCELPLACFCMGCDGVFSRVLSKIYGGRLHYCSIDGNSSIGQLSYQHMVQRYNFYSLNRLTSVYALIGNPVSKSISSISHNQVMKRLSLNSVYVKIRLEKSELFLAWDYFISLSFGGLSVTMPLKNEVTKFVKADDLVSKETSIVNTVKFGSQTTGINTDASATIELLKPHLNKQRAKVAIYGSGSVAKAFAFLFKSLNTDVYLFSRNQVELEKISKELSVTATTKKQIMGNHIDILINTTPVGMDGKSISIEKDMYSSSTVVFDVISNPNYTPLVQQALNKNCRVVYGSQLFARQASIQFYYWFFL